jgi:hypothetical protein
MIHVHRGLLADGGAPVVNLFPIGSDAFPATWTSFSVPAGKSYQMFGTFTDTDVNIQKDYAWSNFWAVSASPAYLLPAGSSATLATPPCRAMLTFRGGAACWRLLTHSLLGARWPAGR